MASAGKRGQNHTTRPRTEGNGVRSCIRSMAADQHAVRRRILLCMTGWPSCGYRNVDDVKAGRGRSVRGCSSEERFLHQIRLSEKNRTKGN